MPLQGWPKKVRRRPDLVDAVALLILCQQHFVHHTGLASNALPGEGRAAVGVGWQSMGVGDHVSCVGGRLLVEVDLLGLDDLTHRAYTIAVHLLRLSRRLFLQPSRPIPSADKAAISSRALC